MGFNSNHISNTNFTHIEDKKQKQIKNFFFSEMMRWVSTQDTFQTQFYHILNALLSVNEYLHVAHSSLEKYDNWLQQCEFNVIMEKNHRELI